MALVRRLIMTLLALLAAVPALATDVTPSARVRSAVIVRSAPDADSRPVGRLEPGGRATLLSQGPGWYRVSLPDGVEGFVSKAWTIFDEAGQPLVATDAAECAPT